jgi:hypothetical protein
MRERSVVAAAVIEELGGLFMGALQEAGEALATADFAGVEQQVQALGRRVLGRVVEAALAERAATRPAEAPRCAGCGQAQRLVDKARARQLQGLVGDYVLRRAYYHCAGCAQGQAPFDAQVGLGAGSLSPGLARVSCRGGSEDGFETAASGVGETLGLGVTDAAVCRITEGIGEVAEAEVQAAITRAQRGEEVWPAATCRPCPALLLVEVDGVQVHLDDGAWHEMKVGRVAPLGPRVQHDQRSGRTHLALGPSEYCAGLESAEEFWWRVYVTACRLGLGTRPLTVVVLGDGAKWIWERAASFLGVPGVRVVEISDIYHVYEHLWEVGNAVFGHGTPAAATWVEPLKDRLYAEGAAPVLAALDALDPADAAAAEVVRTARESFFPDNAARMDYPAFVARAFPIGSGAVESTCKTLIEAREKQAGMRWSARGAQAVAALRALHRSGRWSAFWQTHPQRRRPPVCPHARARRVVSAAPVPSARPATRALASAGPTPQQIVQPPAPCPPPPAAPARAPSRAAAGSRPRTPPRPAANHPWRHLSVGRPRSA